MDKWVSAPALCRNDAPEVGQAQLQLLDGLVARHVLRGVAGLALLCVRAV